MNANSCQQLDAQECSLPIKIPPLTTEMPVVSGNVNDGTLMGGNWKLVRRLAIPSDLKEVEERVVVFPSSPMGIGIFTAASIESSKYPGAVIGSVSARAASLGVVEGSQIMSVNGIDVSRRTFEEMRPLLDRARWPLKMVRSVRARSARISFSAYTYS